MSKMLRVTLIDAIGRSQHDLLLEEEEALLLIKNGLAFRTLSNGDLERESRIFEQSRIQAQVKKPRGVRRR